jgi:hypothetical protein
MQTRRGEFVLDDEVDRLWRKRRDALALSAEDVSKGQSRRNGSRSFLTVTDVD